jgi:hypothetical protein
MPSDASVWSLVATVKILLIPKRTVRDAKLAGQPGTDRVDRARVRSTACRDRRTGFS